MTRLLLVLLCIAVPVSGFAQSGRILIDGTFSDWTDDELVHVDPTGDGTSVLDLGSLWITHEDGYVLFSVEVGSEINLQNDNDLALYLDTDADASTGLAVNDQMGAELVWRFGDREGAAYFGGSPTTVRHADVDLFTAPTVTSTRFELALAFDAEVAGTPIFQGETLRVLLRDETGDDTLPDEGSVFVAIPEQPADPFMPVLERDAPHHLRFTTYNVLSDGLFDPSLTSRFQRLLRAIRPDVLALQEIYDNEGPQIESRMEQLVPSGAGERWYAASVGSDVHLASRFPIVSAEPLCENPGPSTTCNGAFLLDLSATYSDDLYVIVAHPPCCANDQSRQREIDLMMGHLRDAQNDGRIPQGTPLVIAGDMNLVGDAQQLRTLLTGDIVNTQYGPDFSPDWDGSDLADARPLTTSRPATYTWYAEGSSFHPGRLDFIIYSDATMTAAHSFSLFTPALPVEVLNANGLQPDDATAASDHLPLVADFDFPLTTHTAISTTGDTRPRIESAYPNPSPGRYSVRFTLPNPSAVDVHVVDVLGRVILRQSQQHPAGAHTVTLDLSDLPRGLYIVKMEAGGWTATQTVSRR